MQQFYTYTYANLLALMAIEILVAVQCPLFHRVHFTSTCTIKKICILLALSALLSTQQFFYGYNTALVYVPQIYAVATNDSTPEGYIYVCCILGFTSICCAGVIGCSSLTIIILRRKFSAPRTSLSNGAIQRDPVTGATWISYSDGTPNDKVDSSKSIVIHKMSNSLRKQSKRISKNFIPKVGSKTTRQFSRHNLLTILFGVRFAVLWFGSGIVSILIAMNSSDQVETSINSISIKTNALLSHIHMNNTTPYSHMSTSTGGSFRRKMRIIRLNIMFYCICLIGIGDILFYLVCNKRFRKANYGFLRKLYFPL